MIIGIGCDIVDVERIKRASERQSKFCETVLSAKELPVYEKRKSSSSERGLRFLAGRWAGKEAFSKALGTGFRGVVTFSDISILNDELGAPYLDLSGALKEKIDSQKFDCHITLSDSETSAMAVVVIEKE